MVAQMRHELAADKGWDYTEYEKGRIAEKQRCLSLLEAALAQQHAACDMGALCIGCEPRNADGSCPGKHVAAKTGDSDNDR